MSLTENREALAADLKEAGLRSYDHIPQRVVPPVAIVSADEPWLEPDETFKHDYIVRLRVLVLAQTATANVVTEELDKHVTATLTTLVEAGWTIERVGQPGNFEASGAKYLGTYIHISNIISIGGN